MAMEFKWTWDWSREFVTASGVVYRFGFGLAIAPRVGVSAYLNADKTGGGVGVDLFGFEAAVYVARDVPETETGV